MKKRMFCFALAVFLLFAGTVQAYAASGTTITASKDADTPYTGRAYIGTNNETKVGELSSLPNGWEWSDPNLALTTSFVQTNVIQRDGEGKEINRVTVKVKVLKNAAETSDIGGNVSEGSIPVTSAVVELRLGTIKVDSTMTDNHGCYDFTAVENGIYNIVAIKEDGKTKTELVTIDDRNTTINVELPVSAVSSLIEFTGYEITGARSVVNHSVIGGLDTIAAKQNPDDGERITIKLTVAPKPYTETAEQKAIKAKAGNGKTIEFLDMSLWRQVNDGNPENIDAENNTLLTIVIPFDFAKVEVSDMVFLRSHDGKVAELTTKPNEYGEYFVTDTNAGIITLYAMKFSEYGITYEMIHEHEWDSDFTVDIEASCTQSGSKSIHCKTCSEVKNVNAIPAIGHRFGSWQTITAPTCEEKGSERRVCSVCGFTETRDVDPVGHEWDATFIIDTDPTCTKEGSKSIHCKHCDKTKAETSVPATGHSFGDWQTVTAPACEGKGSEKRVCSICGFTETRNVDFSGHAWESDYTVDKEPTCTQDGSRSIHCKNCEMVKNSTVVPAFGHSFGDWQTVIAPTCEGKGSEKHICMVCRHEEMRDIVPSGHAWESDYTVDKEPTCTKDGSKSIHCKDCGAMKDSTVIPHLEHTWGSETVLKEATNTEDGEKIFTCERCGETRHVLIPKTGDIHKCIIHWFMIALLALFIIMFVVFTLKKKTRPAFVTCGVFGAVTIVFAFFGGCTICTVLTAIDLIVIAAGAIFTVFKNKPPRVK